jgi:chromosome segregation ATPase
VVVENDEISTKIIKHLNSLKGGRVTFIPLNRVRAPHVSYPQSSDVVPLLKKLKFSPDYTPAFAQVCICHGFRFLLETHIFYPCMVYDTKLVISLMSS